MVIAYVIIGMVVGSLLGGLGFFAGIPLWAVFLLYSFGGSFATLGSAVLLVYVLPRETIASADKIGSTI